MGRIARLLAKVKIERGKRKSENGKVRRTPQSLRDSSPINKGAEKVKGENGKLKMEKLQNICVYAKFSVILHPK